MSYFLFFAFAMAHYGPGATLLISYLGGAAANAAAFAIYPAAHQSLGASGMVMAGLGLLGVHSFAHRQLVQHRRRLRQAMAGAFLILVLFGFSPGTDVLAHVGGFAFGALGGIMLRLIPSQWQSSASDRIAGWILIGLVAIPWFLALSQAR